MKIYVASSWRNPHQPKVVEVLRSAGHEVYDFRHPDPANPDNHGFSWKQTDPTWHGGFVTVEKWRQFLEHPVAEEGFRLDFDAMKWCEACVFVLPAGRSASFEIGWCMGAGKHGIVVVFDPTEPELMFREAKICGSLSEVLFVLDELKAPSVTP